MKHLRSSIQAAEKRTQQSKILLTQHYEEFTSALKSAATSKTSFFATLLGGAALGYFSGGGFGSKVKNRFSGGANFSWANTLLKVLFPYITGSLLGMLQTFFNRRTANEDSEPQAEQKESSS